MVKSTSRRGRPLAVYRPKIVRCDPIVGLMRLTDGRWRASGPEKYTFTEPDEALAIAHYHEWKERNLGSRLGTLKVHLSPVDALIDICLRNKEAGGVLSATIEHAGDGDSTAWAVIDEHLSASQWLWLRRQIIDRPKWVAARVGIEQIGYLKDLEDPTPVPSLAALQEMWEKHFNSSPEQRRKCPVAFNDFVAVTGINCIEDIKPEVVVAYRDAVYARKLTGKTQSNVFTRVRRYLTFFRDRAVAIDAINRAVSYLELLTPDEQTVTLNPMPIEAGDWTKLLAASKADDRAMILLMLNCAMYLQEVIRVKWSEINDGCLITHRRKTGRNIRVATLWAATLEALNHVQHRGEFIFVSREGSPLGVKGAELRFRQLRDNAEVPHVTASQLRDGAATAMASANVNEKLCNLLMGHSCGISDRYAKRNPRMVATACDAIRKSYGLDEQK